MTITTPTTASQRAKLAAALGISPSQLGDSGRWLEYMKDGVVVRVHMSRWRARTALDFDDLGLPRNGGTQVYDDLITLGSKLLLDRDTEKQLASTESQIRQTPGRFGFETAFGTFIPATAFQAFREEMTRLEERWFKQADNLAANRDRIIQPHMDKFAEAARVAYRRANRLQAGIDKDFRYLPEDQYVDNFMKRIRSMIPDAAAIRESFTLTIDYSFIPLPSMLAADEAEADRVRIEAVKDREALQAERRRLADIEAMNQAVVAQAKQQKEAMITSFIEDVAAQMRGLVYEVLTAVNRSIERNGSVHGRSVVQLTNLIEQLDRLNFTNDAEITKITDALRDQVNNTKDAEAVAEQIRTLKSATRKQLIAMGQKHRVDRVDGAGIVAPDSLMSTSRRNGRNNGASLDAPQLSRGEQRARRSL